MECVNIQCSAQIDSLHVLMYAPRLPYGIWHMTYSFSTRIFLIKTPIIKNKVATSFPKNDAL